MDVDEFLEARLAEDEEHGEHRLRAEVAAKRIVLDQHGNINDGECTTCVRGSWGYPTHGGSVPLPWPCPTLKAIASVYASHPDFKDEWTP